MKIQGECSWYQDGIIGLTGQITILETLVGTAYGGDNVTIGEAVLSVSASNEDAVVYALEDREAWQADTSCVLIEDEVDEAILFREGTAMYYFLEICAISEVIEGWTEISSGNEVSDDDIIRVVIYYARNDTWPKPLSS